MALKVYSTLSRKKEPFSPKTAKKVKLFVCGPTVYDHSHIGHARSYVVFDVIAKYLRYKQFDVFYLQNITDIDDKIIERANKEKKDSAEIAKNFEASYYEDMEALGIDAVTKYAKATDYISQMIDQIKRLIKAGNAYEAEDGVYYDITSFSEYGKLSKQNLEELKVRRIEPNPNKKNPGDFSLWKKQKPGEPSWDSPWGKGRPGWHIEDTAITEKEFGAQYDVHGGGLDLIFPHHEAEIAQMEGISKKSPLAKYWLHNEFLQVNGEKMSKSLGNFLTIKDALKKWSPQALRYFFFSSHYRSPINFTEEAVTAAGNAVQRAKDFMLKLDECKGKDGESVDPLIKKAREEFEASMDDDFEISGALGAIFEFIKEVNTLMADGKIDSAGAQKIKKFISDINKIFGIFDLDREISEDIQSLVDEREKARKEKDFAKADKIRDELKEKGIVLEDTPHGIRWKRVLS